MFNSLRESFYWHVPGGSKAGFWMGLLWNYRHIRKILPLLTLTAPYFWRYVYQDYKNGFRACGCGRTWWKFRMLPALVGDKRFGGGC